MRSRGAPGRRAAAATTRRARAEAETLDARARAACERGDYAEAAERCAEALALLRGVFPAGSPQLAHEAAKLGRLYFNARADRRAAAALRAAADAMEACFGADAEVEELRRLEAMCVE